MTLYLDLNKSFSEYLEGYPYMLNLTLNEKRRYKKNGLDDYSIQTIEKKFRLIMNFLSRRIVARKELGNVSFRAVATYEISKDSYMVHAHIIVGLKYKTLKSIEWINKFIYEKWNSILDSERTDDDANGNPKYINKQVNKKKYNADEKNKNTLVEVVKDFEGSLIYLCKDTSFYQRNQLAPYSFF